MAKKVLGQSNPSATTATTLYTVPSGKSTVSSSIAVCNQGASAASYRLAVRPAGESLAAKHYIAYDCGLAANSTDYHTVGVTLAETDVVTIYASSATMSFNMFGDES